MKATPKRIRETREVQFQGNIYEVECDVYPGEPETRDYPGSGDDIVILSITLDDEEVMDSLTISEIVQIQELALEQ
jgi:hypothetical protein